MDALLKAVTDQYGPVWLLVGAEAWLIWWIVRRFMNYIEKDIQSKVELASALREMNARRKALDDTRGNV